MNEPIRFNETHRHRTAAELEAHCGGQIVVLPLAARITQTGRYVTVRNERPRETVYCEFNDHPYVRRTPYAEPAWLCDHAGRAGADQLACTHVACIAGTRLESMLRGGTLTADPCAVSRFDY